MLEEAAVLQAPCRAPGAAGAAQAAAAISTSGLGWP